MTDENPVILALYPNTVGIGYVCLQIPQRLLGYGIITVKSLNHSKFLRRAEKIMSYYCPKVIILKEMDTSRHYARANKLIDAITTLACEMNMEVFRYSPRQIKETFDVFGAKTKFEMANKIIQMLPDLAVRAPKLKKWYEREDYRMVLFDAVSLAVTHAHLNE